LGLLYVGTLVSFTPTSILYITPQAKGVDREPYFSWWLNLTSYAFS